MKNFWKIVMLTVLCVSLLCGVTAMAEADRFQFEKTNLTVFEGNTLELSLIRQGNCAADVKLAVTEAVAALTGLSADRITVAKSQ